MNIGDEDELFQDEVLEAVPSATRQESEPLESSASPEPPERQGRRPRYINNDIGNAVLAHSLGPNYPDIVRDHLLSHEAISPSTTEVSSAFTERMEVSPPDERAKSDSVPAESRAEQVIEPHEGRSSAHAVIAAQALEATEGATALDSRSQNDIKEPPAKTIRVDSTQETVPLLATEGVSPHRSNARSPLSIQTATAQPPSQPALPPSDADTIAASPILSKHVEPVAEGKQNTLPAVQPTSPVQGRDEAGSPQKLPSIRQLTVNLVTGSLGRLNELADTATQDTRTQPYLHHHSQSFGSSTAQSPHIPYHPGYPGSSQTSPASQYASYSARSPTSTLSEMTHTAYGSPTQYTSPAAYYAARRRSSVATEAAVPYPHLPASLPSASSSGESHGPTSSISEGYSTSHTTPIDQPLPGDGTPRPMTSQLPILPPPSAMPSSFRCDYPGCNAAPFQTQYLLR